VRDAEAESDRTDGTVLPDRLTERLELSRRAEGEVVEGARAIEVACLHAAGGCTGSGIGTAGCHRSIQWSTLRGVRSLRARRAQETARSRACS
jgi:hypothetical protein